MGLGSSLGKHDRLSSHRLGNFIVRLVGLAPGQVKNAQIQKNIIYMYMYMHCFK